MPSKKIPCKDCADEKKKIEDAGDCTVISCDAIPKEPGWCLIVWQCGAGKMVPDTVVHLQVLEELDGKLLAIMQTQGKLRDRLASVPVDRDEAFESRPCIFVWI